MSEDDLGCLQCPQSGVVPIDQETFRIAVMARRCPLTTEPTENWSRSDGVDGALMAKATQRCPCGAQWSLHGDYEVAWPSSPMVRFVYPDEA